MSGAVLVTLVSTMLVNLVGVGRIAHLLHLSFRETLPWSRLAAIFARAGIAAVPVLWIAREWALRPLVGLAAASAAYAIVYFGLSYGIVRLKGDATEEPGRMQAGRVAAAPAFGVDHQ
jgi:hypothetical protein